MQTLVNGGIGAHTLILAVKTPDAELIKINELHFGAYFSKEPIKRIIIGPHVDFLLFISPRVAVLSIDLHWRGSSWLTPICHFCCRPPPNLHPFYAFLRQEHTAAACAPVSLHLVGRLTRG
jgi:hypothetical protein